ncbi:Chromosome partition protein Smc [bioreactor metagenome]|uniref:Chromosome partition protein Smc n=1 Tax=bioreactor metagenome TaxID=1076179 RepID=A0A644WD42_9ZZZZ
MDKPDIRILVGVEGSTSIDKGSGKLILKELRGITEKISSSQTPRVTFGVSQNESKKQIQAELQRLASSINVNIPIKVKLNTQKSTQAGSSASSIFDTKTLEAEGRKYFKSTANVLDRVKKSFSELGTVDITNVFKSPQGDIESFTASVKKADSTVESYRFQLSKITSGTRAFKGFAQMSSVLTDKSTGSGLQGTLNYLNNIETKLKNLTSKTTTSSAKPLLEGMPQFSDYNTKLQQVSDRIKEIRNSTSTLSDEHKREINSMVADLQRYAKELQNSAYSGSELKAQTFSAQKAQYQADLDTRIKQWTSAGIFGGEFEQSANKAKTLLDSATDSTGLDRYREKLKLLQTEFKSFKLDNSAWDQLVQANTLSNNIQNAQLKIQNLKKNYSAFVGDPKLVKEWQGLFDQSQIISSQKELTNLNSQIGQFEQQLISAGKHQKSTLSQMAQNASKMAGWMAMGTLIAAIMGGIRGLYGSVIDINIAMVDLKKVTDETSTTYNRFLKEASSRAVQLGTSITDLVQATANFAKLGYSLDDAKKLAEYATIYQNVGDDVESVDTATQSIVSTMKAFGIASEDAMSIVDKFNEVGNKFAISSGGIGEAMQRAASSLSSANNTIDESIALIVAANNVVQDPDAVGTMWKTVAMRIRGAKTELEEAGLDTDAMAESTAKLRDEVRALTNTKGLGGLDIMQDEKTFKSTYDIILGISNAWKDMSDIDQAALLELLSGKRQGNALAATITNMSDAVKVLKTSTESAGSAYAEHAKWLDSIEAKQQQFAAQYQEFSNTFLSSELIKGVIDTGTGLLGWLTAITDKLGALPVLLSAIGGIRSLASGKGFFQLDTSKDWGGSGIGITTAIAASSKSTEEYAAQIETDYQALLKWKQAIDDNSVSVKSFEEVMSGASKQAKSYAVTMDDAGNTAEKYKAQQTAAVAATRGVGIAAKAASIGVQVLNVAMNMLTHMAIGLAINAIIAGFGAIVNASSNASDKANEFANTQRDISDAAAKEVETLDELIDQYTKLKSMDTMDADTRSEIKDIQAQITSLVGDQASNLDLVNGKLDDQIAKLKEINMEAAKDSLDSYVATYYADRDAADKAVGEDSFLGIGGYGYVGGRDKAAYDILKDITNQYGTPIFQNGGFFNSNLFSTETGTAEERIEQLTAAMDALKNASDYDYTSSALYAGLNQAVSTYQTYVDNVNESTNNLLDSAALVESMQKEIAGETVDSATSYEQYRQSLIDAVGANKSLTTAMANGSISANEISSAVDDIMATNFPEWYEQVNRAASGANDSVSNTAAAFENMGDALSAAKTARDAYSSLESDLEATGKISLDTLTSLVSTYSDLEDAVSDYLSGAGNESTILNALAEKFHSAAAAAGYYGNITEEVSKSTTELIDSVQSSLQTLQSAQEEYSELGSISVDTVQELLKLGPAYLDALINENGQINLNSGAVANLISEKTAYLKTLAAEQVATYAVESLQALMTDSTKAVGDSSRSAKDGIEDAAEAMLDMATKGAAAAAGASALDAALNKLADEKGAAGIDLEAWKLDVQSYASSITSIINAAGSGIKGWMGGSSSSSSVEEYTAEIDQLYAITKKLKDVQNEIDTIEAKSKNLADSDYKQRIQNTERLLSLKQKENDLLHEQTEMRRGLISSNISELRSLGFDIDYDPQRNDLLINNLEHVNKLIGKNQDATNELRKKAEDLIDTTEDLNDTNIDSSLAWYANTEAAKEYKNQLMEIRQEQADEWLEIREHENTLWENQGGNKKNIIANYQQMMDYVHNLADEYRSKEYSEESAEIRKLKELWWNYYNSVQDIINDINQERLDKLNNQKDAMQDILDLTKDLIERETNDHIDALEEARDIYKDIIDLKIKSIELLEEESSYQKTVNTLTSDISKLQAQADALALDDSRDAKLQRAQLLEEISEKQKELSDEQHDYSVDNQKDALEKEYDLYSDTLDDKIDDLKAFLNDNERLTAAAYKRIDSEGSSLYDNLLTYAKKYTDTSELKLKSMWDIAMEAAKKYSSFVAGMNSIDTEISSISGGTNSQYATDDSSVIATMKTNSAAWWNASESRKKELEDINYQLGTSIGATKDEETGRWYRNGVPLYHSGGVIGDNPTAKQKEILMFGETGEMVLTEQMQNNWTDNLQNLHELMSAGWEALDDKLKIGMAAIFSGASLNYNFPKSTLHPAFAGIPNSMQTATYGDINFDLIIQGNVDESLIPTIKREISSAFDKTLTRKNR